MSVYLVHVGTGTIIDVKDDVYLVGDRIKGYEDYENLVVDLATTHGVNLLDSIPNFVWAEIEDR